MKHIPLEGSTIVAGASEDFGWSAPWNEQQEDAGLNAFADAMHRHLNVP